MIDISCFSGFTNHIFKKIGKVIWNSDQDHKKSDWRSDQFTVGYLLLKLIGDQINSDRRSRSDRENDRRSNSLVFFHS